MYSHLQPCIKEMKTILLFCVMFITFIFSDIIKYKVNAHGNEDHAPPKR